MIGVSISAVPPRIGSSGFRVAVGVGEAAAGTTVAVRIAVGATVVDTGSGVGVKGNDCAPTTPPHEANRGSTTGEIAIPITSEMRMIRQVDRRVFIGALVQCSLPDG